MLFIRDGKIYVCKRFRKNPHTNFNLWANEREDGVGFSDYKRNGKMRLLQCALITLISITCSSIYANIKDATQVGRYLVEKNGAEVSQLNPLKQIFSVTFPSNVYRIKDAVSYLLVNSGYTLASNIHETVDAKNLLNQKLPLSDRQMGPMTIQQGLLALSGNTYQLIIDPERRLVSFKLKKPFEKLYLD